MAALAGCAAALHLLAPALQRWNGRGQPTRGEAGSAACGPGRRTCVAIGVGFSGSPRSGPWATGMKLRHCSPARAGSGRVLVFLAGVARGRGSHRSWAAVVWDLGGVGARQRWATNTVTGAGQRGDLHAVSWPLAGPRGAVTRAGHGRARS